MASSSRAPHSSGRRNDAMWEDTSLATQGPGASGDYGSLSSLSPIAHDETSAAADEGPPELRSAHWFNATPGAARAALRWAAPAMVIVLPCTLMASAALVLHAEGDDVRPAPIYASPSASGVTEPLATEEPADTVPRTASSRERSFDTTSDESSSRAPGRRGFSPVRERPREVFPVPVTMPSPPPPAEVVALSPSPLAAPSRLGAQRAGAQGRASGATVQRLAEPTNPERDSPRADEPQPSVDPSTAEETGPYQPSGARRPSGKSAEGTEPTRALEGEALDREEGESSEGPEDEGKDSPADQESEAD